MTQKLDPKALRKVVEQATPGPWEIDGPANPGPDDTLALYNNDGGAIAYIQPLWDDAEFIATFDPPTVLALLTQLEQAQAQVARVRELADAWKSRGEHDMEYSKTIPQEIGEVIFEGGAELVNKANLIDRALDGEPV